jgi:hypothetical protein
LVFGEEKIDGIWVEQENCSIIFVKIIRSVKNILIFFDFFQAFMGSAFIYRATIALKQNKEEQAKFNQVVRKYRIPLIVVGSIMIVVSAFKIVSNFM